MNQLRARALEGAESRNLWAYARSKLRAKLARMALNRSASRGSGSPRTQQNAYDINWFAAVNYRPRAYAGRIILFRTTDHRWDRRLPFDLGWRDLASGGLEIVEIPGDHASIYSDQVVGILAGHLDTFIG